jgi:hypothetical protein
VESARDGGCGIEGDDEGGIDVEDEEGLDRGLVLTFGEVCDR